MCKGKSEEIICRLRRKALQRYILLVYYVKYFVIFFENKFARPPQRTNPRAIGQWSWLQFLSVVNVKSVLLKCVHGIIAQSGCQRRMEVPVDTLNQGLIILLLKFLFVFQKRTFQKDLVGAVGPVLESKYSDDGRYLARHLVACR